MGKSASSTSKVKHFTQHRVEDEDPNISFLILKRFVFLDWKHYFLSTDFLLIKTKFREITDCFFSGNKSGNRRTANIRSIGHSDLFSLSKEDLTDVLSEFPAAKRHLEEKGRQILTKMGMLEESGVVEEAEAEKVEFKIKRLESNLEMLQTKLARLMVELESSNRKMQARVEQLEWEVSALQSHPPEDGGDALGRGEGVGGEVGMEREEAEGEEEEGSNAKLKKQGQGEDSNDLPKEGDGESTKSTKEDLERMAEGDASGQKDPDNKQEKNENDGKKNREKGDDRPGKGDGAEIEPSNESQGENEKESGERRENNEENSEKRDMGQEGEGQQK